MANAELGMAISGPGMVKVKSFRVIAEKKAQGNKQERERERERLEDWLRELGNQ